MVAGDEGDEALWFRGEKRQNQTFRFARVGEGEGLFILKGGGEAEGECNRVPRCTAVDEGEGVRLGKDASVGDLLRRVTGVSDRPRKLADDRLRRYGGEGGGSGLDLRKRLFKVIG